MVGSSTPNYSGLFLRGNGSQTFNAGGYGNVAHASGGFGVIQGDAIRQITGTHDNPTTLGYEGSVSGVFYRNWGGTGANVKNTGIVGWNTGFAISNVVPTANENRPVNTAVRYLIRAL